MLFSRGENNMATKVLKGRALGYACTACMSIYTASLSVVWKAPL